MRAEIIATGSELVTGGITDTNSVFLSDALLEIGIETAFKTIVGDDEKDMAEAFKQALGRVDVVIVTGGLGPTEDDITRKALARVLKKRLVLNDEALKKIKDAFASRKREYPASNDRQALVPSGARLLANPVGIAPGFFLIENEVFVAVLPGVPAEMRGMFREVLRQELVAHCGGKSHYRRKVLRTWGVGESKLDERIQEVLKQKNPYVGLSAKDRGVDIRILARETSKKLASAAVDRVEAEVRKKLGDAVYGVDSQEMEEIVGALLIQRRKTIAVAESCTGGLLSGRFTNISGSSAYFLQGAVTYSNQSKTGLLGVPVNLIEQHGAVSRETASAMAAGIREKAGADLGLAVTGIAGPTGGTAEKPVGLVYIALAASDSVSVEEFRFFGDRAQVRSATCQAALDMVRRFLIS